MKPYPYQYECAYNILTHRMSTSELATSAGKTIIMFMTCVWLKEKLGIDRILIVVPKTMLVNQGIKDFQSYNE
jgi:superfamily II DNA or RNA helicase